jgi:hypothetical protein
VVIGGTMLALNSFGTHYTKKGFPLGAKVTVPEGVPPQKVGRPYDDPSSKLYDNKDYRPFFVRGGPSEKIPRGWYLVDDAGGLAYKRDVPIQREADKMDNGESAPDRFKAPQPQLFQLITEGILQGDLQWGLVITGVLIAVALELMGVSALPVAVGMYLGLSTAMPIFLGGLLRWGTDRWRGVSASEAETETSPGVLLSSGYIAGGTLCGLIIGFFAMLPRGFRDFLDVGAHFGEDYSDSVAAKLLSLVMFAALGAVLFWVGTQRSPAPEALAESGDPPSAPPQPPVGEADPNRIRRQSEP